MSEAAIPFCVPDGGTTVSVVALPPTTKRVKRTQCIDPGLGGLDRRAKGWEGGRQLLHDVLLFRVLSIFSRKLTVNLANFQSFRRRGRTELS